MPDIERVIYDIERCICHVPDACRDCSKYIGAYTPNCMEQLLSGALTLLRKQKAVVPDYSPYYQEWYCGNCGKTIPRTYNFCNYCGREVKWDGQQRESYQ